MRTWRGSGLVGLAVLANLAGCGGDSATAGAGEATVRDSAGITIVENHGPAWQPGEGLRVSAAPVLEVGMLDGPEEYQFASVRYAALLPGGGVAVSDASLRVRVYDVEGRWVRDLGRRGGGPGEFESLNQAGPFRGDSIAAWDMRQKRLTVFDAEGRVGRVQTVDGLTGMISPLIGWLDDGVLIATPGVSPTDLMAADPGERRAEERYLRIDAAGRVDTAAVLPGRDQVVYHEGRSFGTRTVLFGRAAFAAARGDAFAMGESGRYEVTLRGSDGEVRRIVRVMADARPVTAADLAAAREHEAEQARRRAEQMARMTGQAIEGADRAELPARDRHPFFAGIQLDDAGRLWLREARIERDDQPQRWQLFDADGRWLGPVDTPAGLRVTWIGADRIVGIAQDELDVEYVRVYGIEQHGGGTFPAGGQP